MKYLDFFFTNAAVDLSSNLYESLLYSPPPFLYFFFKPLYLIFLFIFP